MPLLIVGKDKKTNGVYAICNAMYKTDHGQVPYQGMSRLDLQRFKNFVFGNTVHPIFVRKLYEKIDFNSYPEELTMEFILKEFLPAAMKIGLDIGHLELDDDDVIKRENFQFFFIQKNRAFDVGLGKVHEIAPGNFYVGSDLADEGTIFLAMDIEYLKEQDAKKALVKGYKSLHESITTVGYPCYLYDSLEDKFFKVEENGKEVEVEMPIFWGK